MGNREYYSSIIGSKELAEEFVSLYSKAEQDISRVIVEIKQNSYWYLTREKFFKKCSDCVFSVICPPLSNYEINSEEIFCPYQQTTG